jgi:lysophospholipase L1-like esterase
MGRNAVKQGNVSLHNVAELAEMPCGGARFQRVPESVRLGLNEHAQQRMFDVVGTEIRFVLDGDAAEVKLHSLADTISAQVFWGDFRVNAEHVVGSDLFTLRVKRPRWFLSIDPERLQPLGFSPQVCRVFLARGTACFHGVSGDVRPPLPEELPSVCVVAYGTSITQGAGSSLRHLCFVAQTAMRLGADAVNLGCAGSALCEAAMADYIASREDWDLAVLALSTNMSGFALQEFRERVAYMVNTVAAAPGERPVACITLWPKGGDLGPEHVGPRCGGAPEEYRQVLRDVVAECGRTNVHLLEGRELLPEWRGLSADLLHPTDHGHTVMAENLAGRLAEILRARDGGHRTGGPPHAT